MPSITSASTPTTVVDYLIVGSGVYGTSIASALSLRGFSVSVLDRSPDGFVAVDGASNDLNKIVRADYTDPNYCRLAKKAISIWRSHPVLRPFYHETGVLFRSSSSGASSNSEAAEGSQIWAGAQEYAEKGVEKARLRQEQDLESPTPGQTLPVQAYKLGSDKQIADIYSSTGLKKGKGLGGFGTSQTGYFNPRGGWAEANNACRALLEHIVQKQGVKVFGNATVVSLLRSDGQSGKDAVEGVKTSDGREFHAKNVIFATGSWTNQILRQLVSAQPQAGPSGIQADWIPTTPSAQCVLTLRLTADEAKKYKDTPVVLNYSSGFYLFEPVPLDSEDKGDWQMKIAIHSNGYQHPLPKLEYDGSYPHFPSASASPTASASSTDEAGHIPSSKVQEMFSELEQVYPELAQPSRLISTRVCWYSDTLDENWILDRLPGGSQNNVWVTSGDSGHGYKFLPILGDLFCSIALPNTSPRKELMTKETGGDVDWSKLLDLTKFSFKHHQDLMDLKNRGQAIESADSNRFNSSTTPTAADVSRSDTPQHNARARL